MATKEHSDFEKLLYSLLERKPPGTSASRIKELTRIAMISPKQYKNIVHSIQKFIQRCAPDYKLGGMYVLDSISQAACNQRGKTSDEDPGAWTGVEYLERFEKILDDIFASIMQCPEKDKEKVKRVLEIWHKKGGIYKEEVLLKLKEKYFPENASSVPPLDPNSIGGNATFTANTSTTNERDPRLRNAPNQASILPATLDSNALLATLNTITQGNLKIPDFLTNPITNSLQQPSNNTTVPLNHNNAAAAATANGISQSLQVPVMQPPPVPFGSIGAPPMIQAPPPNSMPPHQPIPSSTNNNFPPQPYPLPLPPSNLAAAVTTNPPQPSSINDHSEFDYGDTDDDLSKSTNRDLNISADSTTNAQGATVNQQSSAASSTTNLAPTHQFNPEQYNMVNNQFFQLPPQQQAPGAETNNPIQSPQNNISQPSSQQISPMNQPLQITQNQGIPPQNNAQSAPQYPPYPPPAQQPSSWVPAQNQPPGNIPTPSNQDPPQPFGIPPPPWNNPGYQGAPPVSSWNPNGPPPPPNNPPPVPGQHIPPGPTMQPAINQTGLPGHPAPHHFPPPPGHHELNQGPPHSDSPPMQHGPPPLHESLPMHQGPPPHGPHGPPPHGHHEHHRPPPPPLGHENLPEHPPHFEGSLAFEDPSIPKETIKVLSRTLYVGGVVSTMTHERLQRIFLTHGRVSSLTVNHDRNNAFVKMETRGAAVSALRDGRVKVRWGVGFGPKDCFNWHNGESIIPLDRLTETDVKWLLTSKIGGTGGRPLIGGVVVEEPDIIIGEGFSSGSINKRVPLFTESPLHRGGGRGERHFRGGREKGGGRGGRDRHRDYDKDRYSPHHNDRRDSLDSHDRFDDNAWEEDQTLMQQPPDQQQLSESGDGDQQMVDEVPLSPKSSSATTTLLGKRGITDLSPLQNDESVSTGDNTARQKRRTRWDKTSK